MRRWPLLSLDPDLGNGLSPELWRSLERTLRAVVTPFAAGAWKPPLPNLAAPSPLIVIDGLLAREVRIAGRCSAELFGAGDIIRPPDPGDVSALPVASWIALSPGRVALLDDQLLAAVNRSAPLLSSLVSRSVQRGRVLGVLALTRRMRRTDERLLFLFAFLASRWGRIRPDGIRLTLPVTHELLAQLIGTRRQSVTSTLGELRARGILTTLPGGDWLLANRPSTVEPAALISDFAAPCDGRVSLLDIDFRLASRVPPSQLPVARLRTEVNVQMIAGGAWNPHAAYGAQTSWLGLLVIEGFLTRCTSDGRAQALELLGPGDLIRPWDDDREPLVDVTTSWHALVPVTLALLDADLALHLAAWPQLTAELVARASARARWLAARLAISQDTQAEMRILQLFARLTARWGIGALDGIRLPMPLTHEQIGQLVGIRRPSATVALGALRRQGMLSPLADGSWLLTPYGSRAATRVERRARRESRGSGRRGSCAGARPAARRRAPRSA